MDLYILDLIMIYIMGFGVVIFHGILERFNEINYSDFMGVGVVIFHGIFIL